jgi:Ca-activated chloride channel homolog
MRSRAPISFLIALALCLPIALAQNSGQDLPSAPSAAQHQNKPQPPAQPPAATPPDPPPPITGSTPPASVDVPIAPTDGAKPAVNPPASSENAETTATIRSTVNEVNVVFTVTDKHGHFVKDLKREDFNVVDNHAPEQIGSFRAEANLPLQVGLLVDASNSVRDRFKFEQEAAIEFLNQTVRHGYDRAFVVGFDVTPEVTQDFTDDTEALSRGVRSLRPGGGTAMYDALYFACRDKLLKQPRQGAVRRAIVLLSDGDDNLSHVTREEAIEMAQRADVIVYTISTNTGGGGSGKYDKILERIADATGGRPFFPFQINDVANAFLQIQDELRSQYAISYRPSDFHPDGRYHTIEILAKNQKTMRVRSRRGYFAPRE